jgi:hypothetical protein
MPEVSSREFRPDLDREFQYLLGQMPRVDRETFQGLLIENAEISERVLEAENELFDAWVRGDLPRDWRPLFEERLLSTPEGKRKATAARILAETRQDAAAKTVRRSPANWLRRIAAVLCLASAIGLWLWWQGDAGHGTPGEARPSAQEVAQVVETLRLQAITRSEANRPKFRIAASTTQVRFGIPESASAMAELATLEGRTVWKGPATGTVPVSLLPPGLYLFTTFEADGKTAANFYEFEIAGAP